MRIVVTGALGHIGSRLIRELATACPGATIVMIDNLATERYASLYDLPPAGHYEFIEADILTADLPALFAGAEAVIHLAALTNPAARDQPRALMERVNCVGTELVARACLASGSALLFPSTTSVYGVPDGVVAEDCAPADLRPQSPYAEWKLQSEEFLRALGQREGLRYVIFRMGTIFGPSVGMRFHTAVNQFCWRAVARQPLNVWRTASHQYRPYLDLTDAIRAMLFVLRRQQFDGRVYNVLTLNATVQQVVETLSSYVPDVSITYVDSPLMNRLSYYVDNGRFCELGFEFTGSLARGIRDTVAMLTAAQSRHAGDAAESR
ncbi:MAG: SDR family oxidoreductase [Acidobacteriota bacterium]|nr:SDR family oxidoreductase [Acidobacteriota bacterium]